MLLYCVSSAGQELDLTADMLQIHIDLDTHRYPVAGQLLPQACEWLLLSK